MKHTAQHFDGEFVRDHEWYQLRYPQFSDKLREARERAKSKLHSIEVANPKRRRYMVHAFLTNTEVKVVYFFKSVSRNKLLRDYPPDRVVATAATLDCFSGIEEHVQVKEKRVSAQKKRTINSFGPKKSALQRIAGDILRATHTPHPDQYQFRGGVPAALRAVEAAHRDGYVFGQVVDGINFYPSIRCEGLIPLLRPLPRSTIQNVIWTKARELLPTKAGSSLSAADHGRSSLRGQPFISQGSASSSIVGEIIMKELLSVLPADARNTGYADDTFVHGRTAEEVAMSFNLLQMAAHGHPAGPLRLRTTGTFRLESPFEFLGHEGCVRDDGSFHWQPSMENLYRYCSVIEDSTASVVEILKTLTKISHWRRSYHNWAEGIAWEARMKAELWAKYAYKTRDRISLLSAARRVFDCWRLDGMCAAPTDYLPEPSGDHERQRWQQLQSNLNKRFEKWRSGTDSSGEA